MKFVGTYLRANLAGNPMSTLRRCRSKNLDTGLVMHARTVQLHRALRLERHQNPCMNQAAASSSESAAAATAVSKIATKSHPRLPTTTPQTAEPSLRGRRSHIRSQVGTAPHCHGHVGTQIGVWWFEIDLRRRASRGVPKELEHGLSKESM